MEVAETSKNALINKCDKLRLKSKQLQQLMMQQRHRIGKRLSLFNRKKERKKERKSENCEVIMNKLADENWSQEKNKIRVKLC